MLFLGKIATECQSKDREAYLPDQSRRVAYYGALLLNIIRYPSTSQQNFAQSFVKFSTDDTFTMPFY
jgi:hypothetical protein